MIRQITFSTYQLLHTAFREYCKLQCISMSEKIEIIIKEYLNQEIEIELLRESIIEIKKQLGLENEKKEFKATIQITDDLYLELKEQLKSTRIRPASFLTFAMSYSLMNIPTQEIYQRKALTILKESSTSQEISSVVYGIKYYKPCNDGMELVHTEFFIDICSSSRFYELYQEPKSPFIYVLAVHR